MNITIAEFDDYPIHAERMIEQMDMWKSEHSGFKATLYGIPSLMKDEHWKMVEDRKEWLRVGVHGFKHRRAECRKRTTRYFKHYMEIIKDMPFDKICKPPFYGYGNRYCSLMSRLGYAMSCRHTNDVYRWFSSPLDIPEARMYAKHERPYSRMFGHPRNTPFMFIPLTKKDNRKILMETDRFLFSSEVAEKMSMIYLCSGTHYVKGFDNLDMDAQGATKWLWGERLPYADNSVSMVLLQHSLMYAPIEMYPDIFVEIKRVLCTGGKVVVKEDDADRYIWKPIGKLMVKSHNTPQIVAHYAEEAGLTVVSRDSIQLCAKYEELVNRKRRIRFGEMYVMELEKKGGR